MGIKAFFKEIEIKSLLQSGKETKQIVLVTGADQSHSKSLLQFIASVASFEPQSLLIVYNLGFSMEIRKQCEKIHGNIDVKDFDFSKYPSFVNIRVEAGSYAWKPIIINDVMNQYNLPLCWMDAGNVIIEPLRSIRILLHERGFYSPASSGCIRDWTHPKTLAYFKVKKDLLRKRNLNGACIAINPDFDSIRTMINRWRECSLIKECIAPEGSNKLNHRQDQAVLSVLAHQMGIMKKSYDKNLGFCTHQDND